MDISMVGLVPKQIAKVAPRPHARGAVWTMHIARI